jgi:hypothetical protein
MRCAIPCHGSAMWWPPCSGWVKCRPKQPDSQQQERVGPELAGKLRRIRSSRAPQRSAARGFHAASQSVLHRAALQRCRQGRCPPAGGLRGDSLVLGKLPRRWHLRLQGPLARHSSRGRVLLRPVGGCGALRGGSLAICFWRRSATRRTATRAGIDLSPAVRDFLKLRSGAKVEWRFVDERDVPHGPWLDWTGEIPLPPFRENHPDNCCSTPNPIPPPRLTVTHTTFPEASFVPMMPQAARIGVLSRIGMVQGDSPPPQPVPLPEPGRPSLLMSRPASRGNRTEGFLSNTHPYNQP